MRKIISACLFVADPGYNPNTGKQKQNGHKYIAGTLYNLVARNNFLPDWEFVIFHDDTISTIYLDLFKKFDKVTFIHYENSVICKFNKSDENKECAGLSMTLSRYTIVDRPEFKNADIILFRDVDTEITEMDAKEINSWSKSESALHRYVVDDSDDSDDSRRVDEFKILNFPLLGGAFGIKPKLLTKYNISLTRNLDTFLLEEKDFRYGIDQHFLKDNFWPQITNVANVTTLVTFATLVTTCILHQSDRKEDDKKWDDYFFFRPKSKNFYSWLVKKHKKCNSIYTCV